MVEVVTRSLDEDVVSELVEGFALVIREHYQGHEVDRQRVFEVLNALAITVASVLAVTDDVAEEFFSVALGQSLAQIRPMTEELEAGHG